MFFMDFQTNMQLSKIYWLRNRNTLLIVLIRFNDISSGNFITIHLHTSNLTKNFQKQETNELLCVKFD